MVEALEEGVPRAVAGEPGEAQDEAAASYVTEAERWLSWDEPALTVQRRAAALNVLGPTARADRRSGRPRARRSGAPGRHVARHAGNRPRANRGRRDHPRRGRDRRGHRSSLGTAARTVKPSRNGPGRRPRPLTLGPPPPIIRRPIPLGRRPIGSPREGRPWARSSTPTGTSAAGSPAVSACAPSVRPWPRFRLGVCPPLGKRERTSPHQRFPPRAEDRNPRPRFFFAPKHGDASGGV